MSQRSSFFFLGLLLLGLGFTNEAHAFTITRVSAPILYRDTAKSLVGGYEAYRLTNNDGVAYPDLWASSEGFVNQAAPSWTAWRSRTPQ